MGLPIWALSGSPNIGWWHASRKRLVPPPSVSSAVEDAREVGSRSCSSLLQFFSIQEDFKKM